MGYRNSVRNEARIKGQRFFEYMKYIRGVAYGF